MRPTVDRYATDSLPTYHRQLTDIPPTYHRYSVEVRLRNIDRYSADSLSLSRPTGDRISTDTRPTIDQPSPTLDRLSTACRPPVDRLSTDYRPTIDRLSMDYRPLYRSTVDRHSGRHSGRHYIDTTYSKHDPCSLRLLRTFPGPIFGSLQSWCNFPFQ